MQEHEYKRNASPVERRIETPAYTGCTFSSLLRSEERCHRRVGYKNSVSRFHLLTMSRCYCMHKDIMAGKYKTRPGMSFEVFEPKYRIVTSTSFCDRIPQTSFILNVFYPKVIPNMIPTNFACYKDRGVDAARHKMVENLKNAEMTDYVLKADIKNYFGSIDHETLFRELEPLIEKENMTFYKDVVNSNKQNVGLTLGSEINQLSASSFLYKFDRLAYELDKFERYMDDIIFIASKEICEFVLRLLRSFVKSRKLELSEKKTYIQPVSRPISFLGFTFLKHPSGKVTMKRKKDKTNHEKRKLKNMKNKHVPVARVRVHYNSARDTMRKGGRSGLMKMDKYVNSLFLEEFQNENHKREQCGRSSYKESFFPLVTCGRKDRQRTSSRMLDS